MLKTLVIFDFLLCLPGCLRTGCALSRSALVLFAALLRLFRRLLLVRLRPIFRHHAKRFVPGDGLNLSIGAPGLGQFLGRIGREADKMRFAAIERLARLCDVIWPPTEYPETESTSCAA